MPAPQRKTYKLGQLLGLKRVMALNIALLALVAWGFSGELLRNRDMQTEVDRLQSQADELAAKNSELAELGKRMSDPQELERQARLKLNLRRPGEEVVVIKGVGDAQASVAPDAIAVAAAKEDGGSNLEKWWHYFFR